eukprot:NODE_164_length_3484_cov_7.370569.p1 GENE.NODE_164_length_3484_cov_7.370569~~NODE_164_length_3484_cov_7.370569.p1  ORF type:complete len:1045 (-),score=321.61 NODE_164_length_3484_cov_7.370569:188-3322(-)
MKGLTGALGMDAPNHMKGLQAFIADIRNCTSKEQEQKRVVKELAKIRLKFTSSKSLSGYDKKKYVWKLLYSHMLGYDVDFGHFQAMQLCSSTKFSEKSAGYLAISLLLADNIDILRLVVNSLKNDVNSRLEHVAALALNTVANIGSSEFADNLFGDISKMLLTQSSQYSPYLKRKACICLVRLYRKERDTLQPEVWRSKLAALFEQRDIGLLTSVSGFTIAILEQTQFPVTEWSEIVPSVVQCLHNIVQGECPERYEYYRVAAPWLQTKLLRILQFFPPHSFDAAKLQSINTTLRTVLLKPVVQRPPPHCSAGQKRRSKADTERQNRSNAEHAILFEAMNLLIHLEDQCDPESTRMASSLLGTFISSHDANIRYLGLETMSRLATNPDTFEHLERYNGQILDKMNESDISIRRQSLNLLYALCRPDNWQPIVDELLESLGNNDALLQEELVLKIAIIAEKNAPNFRWYVDVAFRLIESAPDSVSDDVWCRVVQVVTGFDDDAAEADKTALQRHAATKSWQALNGQVPHDTLVKLAAYLVGEFGHLINDATPRAKFEALATHFSRSSCSSSARAILLTAVAKLLNANPDELRQLVMPLLEDIADSSDAELQQRACELLQLGRDEDLLESVLMVMPRYAERVLLDNPLVRRLKFQQKSRAHTRAQLEEAEKSEGGMYKAAAPPGKDRGIMLDPDEKGGTMQDGALTMPDGKGDGNRGNSGGGVSEESSSGSEDSSVDEDDPEQSRRELWLKLCIFPQGRYCTTRSLTLEVKQEYSASQGRMMIMLMNRSQAPLRNITITAPDMPFMRFQAPEPTATLRPDEQAFQTLQFQCMAPFSQPATLCVKFWENTANSPMTLMLALPAIMTKFIVPAELNMQQFMQYFVMMEGPPRENQIVAEARVPPSQWRNYLSKGFGLHVLPESTESTTAAAGTFHTGTQDVSGKQLTFPCLTRLDFEPARRLTRVTVRSQHGEVTAALSTILATHLLVSPGPAQGGPLPDGSPPPSNTYAGPQPGAMPPGASGLPVAGPYPAGGPAVNYNHGSYGHHG